MTEVNICICYVDNISNALEITYYLLKIKKCDQDLEQKKTTVFVDNIIDFSTREWRSLS